MGRAEPSSAMIGRHKNNVTVAMKRDIGELKDIHEMSKRRYRKKVTHYMLDTVTTAGSA